MPVFVDVTERAPTFRLSPLDRTDATERRSWIQVWTPVDDADEAWQALLHRPFRGLDPARYEQPFQQQIEDPYLRRSALNSLAPVSYTHLDVYKRQVGMKSWKAGCHPKPRSCRGGVSKAASRRHAKGMTW